MGFKSINISPNGTMSDTKCKRPKPVLTLSYHLPTVVVQGKLATNQKQFSRGPVSPALIPILSPLEPPSENSNMQWPNNTNNQQSGALSPMDFNLITPRAPHLSQSKDGFSPLPLTPIGGEEVEHASVFEALQTQFLETQSNSLVEK